MKKPKRSDEKYWTGTREFNHIQFEEDLEEYIIDLEYKIIQQSNSIKYLNKNNYAKR